MTNAKSREDRLKTLFKYFVDVVRINIFITTTTGKSVITPEHNPYGWQMIVDTSDIKSTFRKSGDLLEHVDPYGLHHFAIPIRAGYVVLGPLIINKKLERTHYTEVAKQLNRDPDDILDSLDEIRVVSQNQLKSILDLISEAKDFFVGEDDVDKGSTTTELHTSLKALLNLAMRLSRAQSGSIMLLNGSKGLSIMVSEGIKPEYLNGTPLKLGEGISGYALQEKKTLVLTDKAEDNRISRLLKRKEIKQSIVMPFESPGKNIRGVLNLNIEETRYFMDGQQDQILGNLSQITSSALQTL